MNRRDRQWASELAGLGLPDPAENPEWDREVFAENAGKKGRARMLRKTLLKRRGKGVLSRLTRKLDAIFSKYIRLRDSDNGLCVCCTCGAVKPWKGIHAGHYIGREAKNTRWEEQNVHAQCPGCNTFHEGRKPEYTLFLQRRYGPEIVQQLVTAGKRARHFAPIELEALIHHYKEEVERLEK